MSSKTLSSRHLARTVVASSVAVAAAALLGAGPAAAAVDSSNTGVSGNGWNLTVTQSDTVVNSVVPLNSTPWDKDLFVSGLNHAEISGSGDDKITKSTLEVGYEFGFQFDISSGLTLGITPSLSFPLSENLLTGAPTVGVTPGLGGTASIPIKPGPVTEVAIQKKEFTGKDADVNLNNVHLQINGAAGIVTVRPYAKLTTSTASSDDITVTYGAPVVI
ncbi:MspA family porin [Rhodococcoides yunnanense]|uniref:MspA family porin n=1 Tax=Rhodococcoides yunnanense TaxID=278209 RepID=UPI0011150059|nr:MspA family porin [Rhodococcus yunnanensis]